MTSNEIIAICLIVIALFIGLVVAFFYTFIEEERVDSRQEFLDRGCHVVTTENHPYYGPIETWGCPDETKTP